MSSTTAEIAEDSRRVSPEELGPTIGAVFQLASRHYISQCLYTFAKIGAANAIGIDELTPAEIAARLEM